jgi:hypothetical protein
MSKLARLARSRTCCRMPVGYGDDCLRQEVVCRRVPCSTHGKDFDFDRVGNFPYLLTSHVEKCRMSQVTPDIFREKVRYIKLARHNQTQLYQNLNGYRDNDGGNVAK